MTYAPLAGRAFRSTRQQLLLARIFQHRKIDSGPTLDLHAALDLVERQPAVQVIEIVGQRRQRLVPVGPALVVKERGAAMHRSESQLVEFVMTNYLRAPDQIEKFFRQIMGQQAQLAIQEAQSKSMVRP